MNEFKPGLEGVVAVETEIAEPDREGGSLRYRGVDIEELVGNYPYERVWGLLVDDDLNSTMPDPEPYEPAALTGNAPADLQAETARLAGMWELGKLNEISDEQARDDLGRLSAQMMEIVARSAAKADGREPAADDVVSQGTSAAERATISIISAESRARSSRASSDEMSTSFFSPHTFERRAVSAWRSS